jgi:Tol biopolymer transport system component
VPITGANRIKLSGSAVLNGAVSNFQISPDSTRVVFLGDLLTAGVSELFSAPIAAGGRVILSGAAVLNGDVIDYQISPDSARVVFCGDLMNANDVELFSAPLAGGIRAKLSGAVSLSGDVSDFTISGDGSRVLFRADTEVDEVFELYRVQTGGAVLSMDIDLDDRVMPLSDLLMFTRYQLGMRGTGLMANALGFNATVTSASAIENRIRLALERIE